MTGLLDVSALAASVRSRDRAAVGRAITLVESHRPEDRALAVDLLARLGDVRTTHRIGLTGSPGVGKSTLIESLGQHLIASGHRVAVLAVDPSSARSGGSILGDKTRMPHLARDVRAFIRPSPSAGELGGVARRTRETIRVVEAAGFDVVLVETVGVGQSEARVADLVDTFCVLLGPHGGDALQGIKRGILEHVDVAVITKSDGDNVPAARRAMNEYAQAFQLAVPRFAGWPTRVRLASGLTGAGIDELWESLEAHRAMLHADGHFEAQRADQRRKWLWACVESGLLEALHADSRIKARLTQVEKEVAVGRRSPDEGARELLSIFRSGAE